MLLAVSLESFCFSQICFMNFIRTIIVGEVLLEKEIGIEDVTVTDTGRILCKFLVLGFLFLCDS